MDDYEEVSKHKVYGLAGEFTVGKGDQQLRALYLETKTRVRRTISICPSKPSATSVIAVSF